MSAAVGLSKAYPCGWVACLRGLLLIWFAADLGWGQELPIDYGKRRGEGRSSLNGMSGFAAMWEAQGASVQSADRLTPRLDRFDVVVWCPSGRRPIDVAERDWLGQWLAEGVDRTLIVVLRDYDAQRDYLEATLPQVSSELRPVWRRRLSEVASQELLQRMEDSQRRLEGWVDFDVPLGRRAAVRLSGSLATGVTPSTTHVVLNRPLAIPNVKARGLPLGLEFDVALRVDGHPFVIDVRGLEGEGGFTEDGEWIDSQSHVLMVANGSFLANYGLTFAGNRELAEGLIARVQSRERVLFLESGEARLEISDRESRETPTMWDWMSEWPFAFVMPHLLALGVLIYFVHLPVFGRPRRESSRSKTDFGRHVEALGELLERTHDRDYVDRHLRQYHELVKRESTGLGMRSESARIQELNGTEEQR